MIFLYLVFLLSSLLTVSRGDGGAHEPGAPLHGHHHAGHHGASEQHREDKSLPTLPAHENHLDLGHYTPVHDHHGGRPSYHVFHVEFERVEIPFIIALWIFVSSLAKIGK